MKRVLIATLFSIVAIFILRPSVHADVTLTDDQVGAISQGCASIRQSLKTLQKADSNTRVLLGSSYQTILDHYLTPLNIRLVKNNQPSPTLTDIQSDFNVTRTTFSQGFIKYSQSLEELILIDCQAHPEQFYQKLEQTRALRQEVETSVQKLRSLLDQQRSTVQIMEREL